MLGNLLQNPLNIVQNYVKNVKYNRFYFTKNLVFIVKMRVYFFNFP